MHLSTRAALPTGVDSSRGSSGCSPWSFAVSRDKQRQQIESAGFSILLWEDHTKLLKELAARFVFEHGSLEKFHQLILPCGCNGDFAGDLKRGKPGYSLTIAVKN